jgi:hypothetical protein
MSDYENFKANDEEERIWVELYNDLSQKISSAIRGLDEKERIAALRVIDISDTSLMNLYVQALKNEDYETCEVAKILLLERGFTIPN